MDGWVNTAESPNELNVYVCIAYTGRAKLPLSVTIKMTFLCSPTWGIMTFISISSIYYSVFSIIMIMIIPIYSQLALCL